MKYTTCEALMWLAMSGAIFDSLAAERPSDDIRAWKRAAKARYRQIVDMCDDIGPMTKNRLRVSLSGGALWIAVFETAPGGMDEEQFGRMVRATMDAPIIKKAFGGMDPFSREYQVKKAEKDKAANAISNSPYNWDVETIPGRDGDEYTTIYRRCGLCELGRATGHFELVRQMCQMDYISVDLLGGRLIRTKLLSEGDELCDFHVVKRGSKWDVQESKS